MSLRSTFVVLALAFVMPVAVFAQDLQFTGALDSKTPSLDFPIDLNTGDSVLITTEATSGDLDTLLRLIDPNGFIVGENDDRQSDTLDSALGHTATVDGTYTIQVARYEYSETSGNFRVDVTIGDESVLDQLELITRVQLSGSMRTRDTDHFRIHYTLEGDDATTEAFVSALAISVEEIWRIQIDQMGWEPPPSDGARGGNALYDVYMADLYGAGEDALGYASPEDLIGDNPNTPDVIERGATSYIVLENDFDVPDRDTTTAVALLRTTMSHEFNHAIQFGYSVDGLQVYFEATATWMETAALVKDEDATGYVQYTYKYPELCFGSESEDAGGLSVYGHWLFIQAMVDRYGEDVVRQLWENIAGHDGLDALKQTVEQNGDTLESMLANYNIQNLVRDYALAPVFDETVWREDSIDALGRWTYTGKGIQELATNYFEVTLPAGRYYAGMVNDNGIMDLWGIGVRDQEADAFDLTRGGTIDTTGYDHYYLMVFNPQYDDPSRGCRYFDYSIDISAGKNAPNAVTSVWDARYFEPLR